MSEKDEIIEAEIYKDIVSLKKELKQQSKNQLIRLVFSQMKFAIDQQNVNKVLMEKLKEAGIEHEDND